MTESYMDLLVRLQIARQEAVGRHRSNVLVETKDLSALLDRFTALEEALEAMVEAHHRGQVTAKATHAAFLKATAALAKARGDQ